MVKVNGGEVVCLTEIQLVEDNALFDADNPTPHFTSHKNQCYQGAFPDQSAPEKNRGALQPILE